jgi:hypothetical protein
MSDIDPRFVALCEQSVKDAKRIAELEAQMRTWLTDYAGDDERVIPVPRYQIENILKR